VNGENELDLHGFRPQDLSAILKEFLEDCRRRHVHEVRIIHGRGSAQLARSVHSLLARSPGIEGYAFATHPYGGMGATWVRLSSTAAMSTESEQDKAHSESQ
jgi:DNA-nicking Smr family endonuclease